MVRLIYDPAALAEIEEAAAYYEEQREGLGRAFLLEVESGIEKVSANPLRWRRLSGPFRRFLIHRFPYGIIYAVDGEEIYVVAVMHLKRKPGYWMARVRR